MLLYVINKYKYYTNTDNINEDIILWTLLVSGKTSSGTL
jgi:hypothetical protein